MKVYGKDWESHETAVVERGAVVGCGTHIWHFCHVMPQAVIGEHCNIGQNCFVDNKARIGNNCKLQNNVSIYNQVTLEDGVFCGPSCVFTNVINPRAEVERKDEYRATLVKRGATIGANATIVCGVTIGEYALIGAGAVVTKDVPAYALMVGNPARRTGWVTRSGVVLHPGRNMKQYGEADCPWCYTSYEESLEYVASGEKMTLYRLAPGQRPSTPLNDREATEQPVQSECTPEMQAELERQAAEEVRARGSIFRAPEPESCSADEVDDAFEVMNREHREMMVAKAAAERADPSTVLDALPLGTAEEERIRAKAWMDDAARHCRSADYWEKEYRCAQEKCRELGPALSLEGRSTAEIAAVFMEVFERYNRGKLG